MKDFIEYLIAGLYFEPPPGTFPLFFWSVVNSVLRFTALMGAIYVATRAFLTATAHGGF